ncbi:hypothetical protein AB0I51_02575 [Streptomyces sp. NPDC050549]|uniref:hypothetical protein n=1 Tax=Streptomyces sp. NPDC050549 TaxID=3155406 RepID=UPI003448EA31
MSAETTRTLDTAALKPRVAATCIGITGHRVIPPAALPLVHSALRHKLSGAEGELAAISSLAAGADQMFADIALAHGVSVTAVIPGMDYEAHLGGAEVRSAYRRILRSCAARVYLPAEPTHEEAYFAAGRWIVDHCDLLIAVWDGRPARGLGGTGDVVEYAERTGVPFTVVWPSGMRRD